MDAEHSVPSQSSKTSCSSHQLAKIKERIREKIGMARPSYNPLSVLCGIQLCGLPGTLAAIMEPCLALVPTGRPFHSAPAISALLPHRARRIGYRFCFVANHLWLCLTTLWTAAWTEEFPQKYSETRSLARAGGQMRSEQ